jgi:hypothetical protein
MLPLPAPERDGQTVSRSSAWEWSLTGEQISTLRHQPTKELEQLLSASFPNAGDADRICQTFAEDIGVNRLGVGAHRKDGAIHFTFPIVVLVGRKE